MTALITVLRDFAHDLRHGLRSLRKTPGFTAMVALSLAIGIGANAAIFSVINFVFLRPLPVPDPENLVLFSKSFNAGNSNGPWGPGPIKLFPEPLYRLLREQNQVFSALAAQQSGHTTTVLRWLGPAAEPATELADGRVVSAGYFEVLGVPAFLGRTFLPEDETAPGANPVLVLSHRYWQQRFRGDPSVIGSTVTAGKTRYTVIGVAAPRFNGTRVGVEVTDFWVPMTMQTQLLGGEARASDTPYHWLVIVGRLAPGVSLAAADAHVNVTLQQFLAERPGYVRVSGGQKDVRIALAPGGRGISPLRQDIFRNALTAAMAGVALLLLIVCLNVGHLLLARALGRQREMSIRRALGATRGRLLRQLLAEGLLLSLLGGAAGALATRWLLDGLLSLVPGGLPLVLDVELDRRVFAFIALVSLAATVILGLIPAVHASRSDVQPALQGSSHAIAGEGSRRLASRLLLTGQVALSLVLLVAAGLLSASLDKLRRVTKGFDEQGLLLVEMKTHLAGIDRDQAMVLHDDLVSRVTALPGVRAASLSHFEILSGSHARDRVWVDEASPQPEVEIGKVTPGYFETLGIPLRRGRALAASDRGDTPAVAVVNETFARRLFPGEALGRHFQLGPADRRSPPIEVVGIVRDVTNNGLRDAALPMVYRPVAQAPSFLGSLQVRTDGDPAALAEEVRRTIQRTNAGLPIVGIRTMSSQVERALSGERILATLATAFGATALFLVCIGLHGVISQWALRRTREIGVRMALGASAAGVRWLVMRHAFLLVLAGLAVGVPAALAVARLLRRFLFGLDPMDPVTLAAAALVMLAVAALSAYLPARRASRVDPMAALRSE